MRDVAGFISCDESLVSLHERGKRRLTEATLESYARLYCVEKFDLFQVVYTNGEIGSALPSDEDE